MLYVELAIVVALILTNGLLAMAELAVVSSRRARPQALVDREILGSRRALALHNAPGRFLSSVQIGITLVGVLSGAFSGATLGLRLGNWLAGFGIPQGYAEPLGVGLVVAAITYVSLIVGELVPKQIALRNPEAVAVRVAPAMTILARIAAPLVWLLDVSGRALLRLLGQHAQSEGKVTDDEIRALVAEAETAGVIEPGERSMIAGVMRLGDRPVRALMTPRREVDVIDISWDQDTIRTTIIESIHSRLPVHDSEPDNILGVLQAKDLLNSCLCGEPLDVRKHIRQATTAPDTADAIALIDLIRSTPLHMVLVHDEYGHFEGVVTNADILEAIVGNWNTDDGPPAPHAVRRDDGSWLISGSMPVDEFAELCGLPIPEKRGYSTVAGFVLDQLGYLPAVGETFEAFGWKFEVVDLDGRRIDKVLATRIRPVRRARA
jgi:putative hemolysin